MSPVIDIICKNSIRFPNRSLFFFYTFFLHYGIRVHSFIRFILSGNRFIALKIYAKLNAPSLRFPTPATSGRRSKTFKKYIYQTRRKHSHLCRDCCAMMENK